MKRRTFVASTFGTALAPAAARIRVGFLGAAHSHAQAKIEIARTSPDWELAGLWEPDRAVAARYEKTGVRIVGKEDLLGDSALKVIAVESEVKPHAEHALWALEAGKHLHLEKPPSVRMADFQALVALARKKDLRLQMGYMWRYHPGMNAALEAARQGWLGDVYLVRGQMNTLIGASQRPEWALFHGGQMFEQGGHLIDPMVRLMGRPLTITPFLRRHGKINDDLKDNTAAVFEFPGALGIISSSVLQPGATAHRSFEILGSSGTAVLRPIEGPPRLDIDLASSAGPYAKGSQTVPLPPFERYVGDFADLARAVREGRPLANTLEEDLLVHEALLRASEMWA